MIAVARERLVGGERAQGVADVLPEVVEPAPAPDVARVFAQRSGLPKRAGFAHHRAMRLDVGLQLSFMTVPVHEVPDPATPLTDGIHGLMIRIAMRSPACRQSPA